MRLAKKPLPFSFVIYRLVHTRERYDKEESVRRVWRISGGRRLQESPEIKDFAFGEFDGAGDRATESPATMDSAEADASLVQGGGLVSPEVLKELQFELDLRRMGRLRLGLDGGGAEMGIHLRDRRARHHRTRMSRPIYRMHTR